MTVHVVLADPPDERPSLPGLIESSPLDASATATLAEAMLQDVCRTIESSGGELVVGVRRGDRADADAAAGESVDEPIATVLESALEDPGSATVESFAGQTPDEQAATALERHFEEANATSVAIVSARSPTLARTDLDGAAMKLRRSDAVVAPAPGDRFAYLGLSEPLGLSGRPLPPELTTVVDECVDTGHETDFLSMHPVVTHGADLVSLVAVVESRRTAGRWVPPFTTEAIDGLGLRLRGLADDRSIVTG